MSETFPNPISLITRFAADGGQAEEILICTFNQNLPFFERHVLAPCRATGARVTVLGDITMAEHDLAAVSRANRRYYSGNVSARRSFHPKLVVLVSPEEATVAVGSGNLTVAGWLGNDELWTIHHANAQAASPVVAAAGQWCRRLGGAVKMSELASGALDRVATLLDRFESSEGLKVKLLDSLDRPILDQLPTGPVDELNLYAPFHDSNAEATRRLIERFEPHLTRVAYQPGLTSADGRSLAAVLDGNVELVELPSNPYRHGKLIEWRTGLQWWSLTGSPNLSTAALCEIAAAGGNVELAVLAPSEASLLPAGVSTGVDSLTQLQLGTKVTGRREVPLLLAATLVEDGVHIEFTRALPQPAVLQFADPDTPPDSWPISLDVAAGTEDLATARQPAGSRVRLRLADGRFSNTTFVADPIEVLTQSGRSTATPSKPPPTIEDVFTDPLAGKRFVDLLEQLPKRLPASAISTHGAHSDPDDEQYTVGDWRDYLSAAETTLSPQLVAFALGRTLVEGVPRAGQWSEIRVHNWDGTDLDDAAGGLDDDDPDDAASEPREPASDYQVRQRTRAACWRNLTAAKVAGPLEGMMRLRLMLTFVAAGGFDTQNSEWVPTVLDTVKQIGDLDLETDIETEVGSLVAVTLAATASTLSPVITTTHHARQRAAEHTAAHLLAGAEPSFVEAYGADLTTRFGTDVRVESVLRYAARIVNANPLDDAVADMQRAGFAPSRDGSRLEIIEDVTSPPSSALAAISKCRHVEVVSVMCRTPSSWALAAYQQPHLLVLQPGSNGRGWGAVYNLSGAGLGALQAGDLREISDREVEMFTPLDEPGKLANAVLDATGWTRDGQRTTSGNDS